MSPYRIDVHTHLVPPFWAEGLKSHGGDPSGWGAPEWSPDQVIRFMDDEDIAISVLSLTAPGIGGWTGSERVGIARRINDYGADLVKRRPDRFGYLATLALPDVDAGLVEIGRAFDELDVDGVVLHSNFDGVYLGDRKFEPIWEELDRRGCCRVCSPNNTVGQGSRGDSRPARGLPGRYDIVQPALPQWCGQHSLFVVTATLALPDWTIATPIAAVGALVIWSFGRAARHFLTRR
jgi:predicted TIM-barrel fold metal-dependent hydrolase